MTYVSQTIMLTTLNVYSAGCQLNSIKLEEKIINTCSFSWKKKQSGNSPSTCYTRTIIKTVSPWQRTDTQIYETENPEIEPHKYAHFILKKVAKSIQWRMCSLFNKWYLIN